ncbi:uncharacterized protein [Apostichopus japonicus]|uniref:uncharacterized protein isoform X2 n=1 Tax=Stichopus japonicus TaxID=307972 RepID=UPI003AB61975
MKTLLLLFGIFFLSVLLGSAEGKMVAFVNFVVRHSFVTQSNGITDMTVAAAFKPHEISETISGTNLWRLGFFGARNMEGTGPRANEIHQLLSPAQRSQTAFPGQNLTFDASSRVNLNNIGPDQSFPFYCVEFAKNPLADPDFTFQVANDEVPAILCQNSQSLPRSAPEQETRPSALFTSLTARFQITKSPDDTIPSRATITVTLEPHPRTDVITGTNLWQLGFFGSRNSDGSGERKNESPQLLLPVQASQPLHPNEPFVLSVERLINMAGIAGTDESFSYLCVEFGKQPTASPEFLFLGSDEDQTIVLCEKARDTEQVPDAFPVDTIRPQILECPDIDAPSVIAIVELGITSAIVPFNEPTATDASNSITVDSSCNSGDRYPVGTTTCTFTFTDSSGNRDQCVFTITVLTEDTTPPEVFQCPDEVTAIVELGITSIVMLYDEPFATDNSNATNLLQNQTCQPGGSYPVGETSCLYLFVDPDGNKNSCIFLIKVTTSDQTRPTISNCPTAGPSTIVELGLLYGVVLWTEPTATDLAGATLLPRTGRPGDSFPLGNTPIVYVFTDPSGNEATCTFIVTVTTD